MIDYQASSAVRFGTFAAEPTMQTAAAVERATRPTYAEFRARFLKPQQPVLLQHTLDQWPAMQRWSFDHVERALAGRAITPVIADKGKWSVDLRAGMRVAEMDFTAYRAQVERSDAPPYYLRLALEGPFADLLSEDYSVPMYCRRRIFMKKNLWLGGSGTTSGLHYDMMHNLVAQVVGKRRVVLFAPEERRNLYPHPVRSLNWHHSPVRIEAPDLARFPRLARAQAVEIELGAGDMLFIPRGWWHHFASLERAIAVNFFWVTPRLAPTLALARAAWVLSGIRT